jgi:hypothetical protein
MKFIINDIIINFGLIKKMLWLKRIKILINKSVLNDYLTTTCKSLKEFVLNAIAKIQKKIEKEDENNLISVNLVDMFGLVKVKRIF